jgi:hypothetical protein
MWKAGLTLLLVALPCVLVACQLTKDLSSVARQQAQNIRGPLRRPLTLAPQEKRCKVRGLGDVGPKGGRFLLQPRRKLLSKSLTILGPLRATRSSLTRAFGEESKIAEARTHCLESLDP